MNRKGPSPRRSARLSNESAAARREDCVIGRLNCFRNGLVPLVSTTMSSTETGQGLQKSGIRIGGILGSNLTMDESLISLLTSSARTFPRFGSQRTKSTIIMLLKRIQTSTPDSLEQS